MIFLSTWLTLTAGNFIYAAMVNADFSQAVERSYFQGAAILLLYVAFKFGAMK